MMKAVFDYYGRDLSDAVLGIYWSALRGYDLAAIREALSRHVKNPDTGQFPPKVADVEKMLGGSTLDTAMLALAKFETAMARIGSHRTVVFDDPIIHVVSDEMGGWIDLCSTKLKDWEFRRTEFLNRYRTYKLRGTLPPHRAKLVGVFDGTNASNGFTVGEENVRLVGDRTAALAVLAGGVDQVRIGFEPLAEASKKILEEAEVIPRLEKR